MLGCKIVYKFFYKLVFNLFFCYFNNILIEDMFINYLCIFGIILI